MNTNIKASPFATRRDRNNRRDYRGVDMDDYSPNRRRSRNYGRAYDDEYDYDTQLVNAISDIEGTDSSTPSYDDYEGYEDYEDEGYAPPTHSSRSDTVYDDYDDAGYEDYGEVGSDYDMTSEPDYYDDYEEYTPERKAPSRLDLSDTQPPRRTPRTPVHNIGTAPYRLDFSETRTPNNVNRDYQRDSQDLAKYLEYLERYDRGDLDNHDMGRIQRAYANKPFWQTFNPSKDLIRKYGSGNRSTRWPMFRREGGRWIPEVWRND